MNLSEQTSDEKRPRTTAPRQLDRSAPSHNFTRESEQNEQKKPLTAVESALADVHNLADRLIALADNLELVFMAVLADNHPPEKDNPPKVLPTSKLVDQLRLIESKLQCASEHFNEIGERSQL